MNIATDEIELRGASAADQAGADAFDPSVHFDQWLHELQSGQKPLVPTELEALAEKNSDIYIDSFPGSNCEVTFEGVLHFDGYSIGNISSPEGTLVLTQRARIEGDINVGVAVINGCVTGNITATERVVLDSGARVMGNIQTCGLSIELGAVFDGDCLIATTSHPSGVEASVAEKQSDEPKLLAVGAAA